MSKSWLLGGMVAAGLLLAAGLVLEPVQAQQNWPSIRVAVINVAKVFKDYEKFKNMSDGFKHEVEAKENEIRAQDNIIQQKIEALKNLKNPADRDRLEREINDLRFSREKNRRAHQAELFKKEADMYGAAYKELTDLLSKYCTTNNIHLVLRLSGEIDQQNPQSILQTVVNREVVYHHPNLDLTEVMTQGLNDLARQK